LTGVGTVAEMLYLWHTIPILVVSQVSMGYQIQLIAKC
jgi:hypothetical protein